MNIFSGSRRIAIFVGTLWVVGWTVAAAFHQTKVQVRYDIFGDEKNATFAGFNLYSCPQKTIEHSLVFKTEAGHPIIVTLCIFGSAIYVPAIFIPGNSTVTRH